MSLKCSACSDLLPPDNDFVQCVVNGCKLHYSCAGVTEKTYRIMGAVRRDNYKCRLCRADGSSTSESESHDKTKKVSTPSTERKQITLENLFSKFESIESFIKTSSSEVKAEVGELKQSVIFCTDKIDDFMKEMVDLRKIVTEVKKENEELSRKNLHLEDKVQSLEQEMQELQQYGRRFNIQLDGVPETERERAMNIVTKLAAAVDEPIVIDRDVHAAHRLPSRNTRRPPPFIIQFTNKQKRDAVFNKAKAKQLKSTDFATGIPEAFVYCNDHLTPFYKKLLFEAKQAKIEKKYDFVWVKGSKIFAKKDKDSRTIRNESMKDIAKM